MEHNPMTYTLLFATLAMMLFIGIAIDWHQEREYRRTKEFQAWLARGVHPSLRQFREEATDGS